MKIAYINLRIVPLIGVDKKTEQQAHAIKELGINNFRIFIINRDKENKENNLEYIKLKYPKGPLGFLTFIYDINFNRYKIIENCIDLDEYDYIILRYPKADFSGIRFAKKYHLITEHHANEIDELELESKTSRNLAIKLLKKLRAYLERKYGSLILEQTSGIIGNSNEVMNIQLNRMNSKKPSIAVPNGVSVEKTKFTKYQALQNKELHCVFLGAANVPYHGIERMIQSILSYKGPFNIYLHIAGNFPKNAFSKYSFIQFHGPLVGKKLDDLMSKMNLGISTLGVYKKGTNEPNSIKTREYVARGLPFILAYNDNELTENPPQKQFFRQFPNNDSLINMDEIISFIKEINEKYSIDELASYMRQYAEKYMDWRIKMKKYIDFVDSLNTTHTPVN